MILPQNTLKIFCITPTTTLFLGLLSLLKHFALPQLHISSTTTLKLGLLFLLKHSGNLLSHLTYICFVFSGPRVMSKICLFNGALAPQNEVQLS